MDELDEGKEMIMRAIEIHKVTREIFMEAMRRSKFEIMYNINLFNKLLDFMDCITIEADIMKRVAEYHSIIHYDKM